MARGGFNDQMMQQGFPGYVMNPYQQFGNHNSTQMEDAMHFMYNNRPRANSLALYPPPNNANQPPFQQSQHHLQPTDHNVRLTILFPHIVLYATVYLRLVLQQFLHNQSPHHSLKKKQVSTTLLLYPMICFAMQELLLLVM